MTISYLVTLNSVVMHGPDGLFQVSSDDPRYKLVKNYLVANDLEAAYREASKTVAILNKAVSQSAKLTFDGHNVFYDGQPLHNVVVDRIVKFHEEGLPIQPLLNFLENLMQNPSSSAVRELYLFLESNGVPITEDGCFLAWKAVRHDFKDMHTGTFDNSPGKVVEMPRYQVDDRRHITCSFGLHVAAFDYASTFGTSDRRLILVKVNPRDVVSVPEDYNNQKMRVCRYEVLQEVPHENFLAGKIYHPVAA